MSWLVEILIVASVFLAVLEAKGASFALNGNVDFRLTFTNNNEAIEVKALPSSYQFTLIGGTWVGSVAGVTVNGGALTVPQSLFSSSTMRIAIVGQAARGNEVRFTDSNTDYYKNNVDVFLNNKPKPVVFSGTMLFTANVGITVNTSRNIVFDPGTFIQMGGGLMQLYAGKTVRDTGNYSGVEMNGGAILFIGNNSGLVCEAYAGVGTGTTGDAHGFHMHNGAKLWTDTARSVSIKGWGSNQLSANSKGYGVYIEGENAADTTEIRFSKAELLIEGNGQSATGDASGVVINDNSVVEVYRYKTQYVIKGIGAVGTGTSHGVVIRGNATNYPRIRAHNVGPLNITGTGNGTNTMNPSFGVYIGDLTNANSAALIHSDSAIIMIEGKSGIGTGFNVPNNGISRVGVVLSGKQVQVENNGNRQIGIYGESKASSFRASGVLIHHANIRGKAQAQIDINGRADKTGSGQNLNGIWFSGTVNLLTTETARFYFNGYGGGRDTSYGCRGFTIDRLPGVNTTNDSLKIISFGSGVTIINGYTSELITQGSGNEGVSFNYGHRTYFENNAGDIIINGTNTSEGGYDLGVRLETTNLKCLTSNNIRITGTGGNNNSSNGRSNMGVFISESSRMQVFDGEIRINGTAGGGNNIAANNSSNNVGIGLDYGTRIEARGNGPIFLIGKGGNLSASGTGYGQNGIEIRGSQINVKNGNLLIDGTNGGRGSGIINSNGVLISESTTISGSGTGTITINGSAGFAGGNNNRGIVLDGTSGGAFIQSSGGDVALTGFGPQSTTATRGIGVELVGNAYIYADTASILIDALGNGIDTASNGLLINTNSTALRTKSGNITLQLRGSTTSQAFFHQNGQIQTQGTPGNINVYANQFKSPLLANTATLTTPLSENIWFRSYDAVTSMILGDTSADLIDTFLRVNPWELARMSTGKFILGQNGSSIYVNNPVSFNGNIELNTNNTSGVYPNAVGADFILNGKTLFCPSSGQIMLSINGIQPDSLQNGYSRLVVQGNVDLQNVSLNLNIAQLDSTFTYVLVQADSVFGTFSNYIPGTNLSFAGIDYEVIYLPNQVILKRNTVLPTVQLVFQSGNDSVCAGTTVVVGANYTNGGISPSFQWYVNGQLQPSNADTLSFIPSNGDSVWVVMTSSAPNAQPAQVLSLDTIFFSPSPILTPSVVLQSSSDTACAGASVTFTALASQPGVNATYTYFLNRSVVQSGSSNIFTTSGLANSDTITVMLTATNRCQSTASVFAQDKVMTILTPVTPTVSLISSIDTICSGTQVTFTAQAGNAGANPQFEFYLNNNVVQSGNVNQYSSSALSANDTIKVKLTANGGCQTTATAWSNDKTVIVNPLITSTISLLASRDTICAGTSVTFTAIGAPLGINPQYNFLLNGSSVQSGTSNTYTNSSLNHGDSIQVVLNSGTICPSSPAYTSSAINMIVNAIPALNFPPIADMANSADSVLLTFSPAGGTLSGPGINGGIFRPYLVDTGTVTLTYSYTSAQGCTASQSRSFRIFPDAIVWDGSQWKYGTPGATQGSRDLMVLAGTSPAIPNGSVCRNLVLRGGLLTHSLNNLLTINENLNLRGGLMTGGGTLRFVNASSTINSLVMGNEFRADIEVASGSSVNNTGFLRLAPGSNIMSGTGTPNGGGTTTGTWTLVQRGSTQTSAWNAFSSPVVNGTGRMIQGLQHFRFDVPTQTWQAWDSNLVMTPGRGYISRLSSNGWYRGTLHDGNYSYAITKNASGSSWNLIGNPYPSQLSWSDFLAANLNINGTAYFMKSNVNVGTVVNDYTAINGLMIGAEVPVSQGFFVEANANGNVNFTNSMRRAGRTAFYTRTNQNVDLIWLKAYQQSDSAQASTTVVGFKADATTGFDRMYDGRLLKGDGSLFVYSLLNQEPMAIQGLPTLTAPVIVPLGVDASNSGTVVFRLDSTNMDPTVRIFLEDLQTSTTHNLRQSAYQAQVTAGQSQTGRFRLLVNPFATTTPTITTASSMHLYAYGNTLVIDQLEGRRLKEVRLTDLSGRMIENWQQPQGESRVELTTAAAQGAYLMTAITTNGAITTERVVIIPW